MTSSIRFPIRLPISVFLAIWLLPNPAAGQVLYGSITGTITDSSGAAVPGATVTITNEETGLELTSFTGPAGTYTIRNVPGGTYTLKASLQGFKEYVQTGVPIIVGGIARINGKLEIGALTESVTVTTEVTLLKTDKADVSVDLRPEEVVRRGVADVELDRGIQSDEFYQVGLAFTLFFWRTALGDRLK